MRNRVVICDSAYISCGSELTDNSRAEDNAYIQGAKLSHCARASGDSMILQSPTTKAMPALTGNCAVYGKVMGDVVLAGTVVVISDETISNDSLDKLLINERERTIIRHPSRYELTPHNQQGKREKPINQQL